ncbi:MAG: phosphonate ABC transporter ATP-binding protein, partial [Acidimicrobiia bacterium]
LADEPAASLDPELAQLAVSLLVDHVADPGRALVLSIHDPDLALARCDRIVALRDGHVVLDVPAGDVDRSTLAEVYRR